MQKLEYVKDLADLVKESKHDMQMGIKSAINFNNKTKTPNDLQINHSKALQDIVMKKMYSLNLNNVIILDFLILER